ncbi:MULTISPECIES: FUSC family protein [unclassified Modestobacter]|uniref:FUSC family protein n=1 Tax=unclassified Modestobacter TaxID=2643866 RepID=UPI0022AA085D|nr:MULTISPECIES: aromatic acid exporter family protein [unclassified Modestobacter]MCZ2825719.1 aromatic acid exporter family protein [Modestobacter sp. VKM Ac-2981]MCZ2853216.1 aromatic acid exporter family protein [Modestobacter sp. VKM Ac-2982]
MGWVIGRLQQPWVQRMVRAALAAGLSWQVALLLPPMLSEYAYYAPLGAVIAVSPTIADSASAAWRSLAAILVGFALAVVVYEVTRAVPNALTIALIVALAIVVEQWRSLFREQANWVSFAAVLMLTVGTSDPAEYAVRYAGLTLLGAVIGVLVTTALFPPLQLTTAVERIARTRETLAAHLETIAVALRNGQLPAPHEWEEQGEALDAALDQMRRAETQVERARRANPRANRWQGTAGSIRAQSRALDRVAVLVDDLTTLVVEFQPHRRGLDRVDDGTGWVLADALEGLAGVVRLPFHAAEDQPDDRDAAIATAVSASNRLTALLRSSEIADDEGFFALGAVTVGMHRSLQTLEAHVRFPAPA